MNLKTTLVLLVLVAVGAVFFYYGPGLATRFDWTPPAPNAVGAGTLAVLNEQLKPNALTRVEIKQGDRLLVLEKAGGEWTLPGRWPTRKPEVEHLLEVLGGLRSRFAPEPLDTEKAELKEYGLDKPAVSVSVTADGKDYVLDLSEKSRGEGDRFSRPTWLRLRQKVDGQLEDRAEIVRLAPGLISELSRPVDYYQQRRLFPSERTARENAPQEKVEQLAARAVAVVDAKNADHSYTLTKVGSEWQLSAPHRDQTDPDKTNALLAALPDVWAERFLDKPDKDLSKYGLEDPPQRTLSVTKPDGQMVTLLIGKESRREAGKPAPEPPPFAPGKPPMPPPEETVYHYAKLKDNAQVFEVRFNKLQKDVLVSAAELRDPRVARFRPGDVRRVELLHGDQKIVFVKDKDDWKLEEPLKVPAENAKVTDLLQKLSNLEAREKDAVTYKADALDKPAATVRLTVEEEVRSEAGDKVKKPRTLTLKLAPRESEAGKLNVKLDGWDRVSTVADDGLLKQAQQPVLAFRSRRILDFAGPALEKIDIQRGDELVGLEKKDGAWKLAVAGQPSADVAKVTQLADELGRLEAVEYVSGTKPEETGLDKPALTATLTYSADSKKPPQKLLVGKQKAGKPDYYAKLDGGDEVFLIRKEVHDDLARGSLAYRPLELWQLAPPQITELAIQKESGEPYQLTRKDSDWRISGPFEASALPALAQQMIGGLANLRAERYETHAAKEPGTYGFDKPYLKITLKSDKEKPAERVLLVGKVADEKAGTRFARLGDGEAVFVIGPKAVQAADRGALDLLDRNVLMVDPNKIERVRGKSGDVTLALQRKGDVWQVVESPAGEAFPADAEAIRDMLSVWTPVQAEKIAAYGPKADLAKFGLDKPAATVTITLKQPKDEKPIEHTLALGKEVENGDGARYARLDNGPAVLVLPASDASGLAKTYLDFVDRTVLKLDPSTVTTLQRKNGDAVLEIVKQGGGWQILKPAEHRADDQVLQQLLTQLSDLKAIRIAAYPAKDLKPFGLEEPAATLTLKLAGAEGKAEEKTLLLGKVADDKTGDRFAQAAGSQSVAVLPGAVARRLMAPPLAFRDRALVRFADADRVILERGARKATFAKVDGTWKLVEPIEAEAEQADLEELINSLARLRADELIVEKPTDLKPYGLDKPVARWRFLSGDKEVLGLLIGTAEKDGPRRHAKLTNGEGVFLLDPKLSSRLLAEYRARSAWPTPLDAVQIDRLTYRNAQGGGFTLEKQDNLWRVVDKPDLKVNAQTVNETLAALAGLRVSQYVQDRDTELNLYGLEPPEWTLEIGTPTGKRVLQLGRAEGESKRRYARVPEKGRGGVFVIAEMDATRIVRDAVAFTREPTKD